MPISLPCMSLDWGRKPEYPEETLDLNITQHSECRKAVGRRCKNVPHSNLSDLNVLDESSSSFFVSPNQPQAELLPKTRYYLRINRRLANRGDQAKAESLSQQQPADPRAQHQGFKETDQPKSKSTGQKRSINQTIANTPQQKRQRTQETKRKAGPSSSSNKPPHCACNEHLKVYELGQLLGTGSFGSVFAGIRKKDGLPVAIKYVSKQKVDEKLEINGQGWLPIEIALMIMVNTEPSCSNILQMLEWYDDPEYYVMILERPKPCEDLANFCQKHDGPLTESTARIVMFQLMKALKHCKSRGVLHCDVKPENILIQTDTLKVKLFDFGCGDVIKESYTDFAGTIEYTPPEWFIQKRFLADPTTVWSVGVTLYRLVCGSLPFKNRKAIKEGHLRFTKNLSQECSHLIRWCLRNKAAARPSLEQLELHHWFHFPGSSNYWTRDGDGCTEIHLKPSNTSDP
ncbi:serine/threonine-protein kinase pim-1-like isoform X3 [Ictalurus furcatus]|uniref:serine/threonine-protein kinase pim-1-like isoform X3 n=1 Tax=Ictalurus furcatus TaxID=66913 RepID=UPI0023509E1C|nr:serine/threonine-protein kinase pim-1-like isoform X3 [Ictalurus furcatus]